MIKNKISVDEVIEFLNNLISIDEPAMRRLLSARVLCTKRMAEHDTVQVAKGKNGMYRVGFLGVLNGLFGVHDEPPFENYGPITVIINSNKRLSHFTKTELTGGQTRK